MDLLEQARQIINEVDGEMQRLFVRRMEAAQMVADYKRENGLPILDEVREAELVRRNAERVEDPLLREYYVNFIRNNMAISRAYQSRLLEGMKAAYCGTEGAFAHIATGKLFPTAQRIAYGNFADAYRAVENGECDVAVLPVENSYNGEVGQVTDLMFSGSLYVNKMFDLAVSHDLLVKEGTELSDVKTVISHPQALVQCADRIQAAGWAVQEYPNTALAAKYVAECDDPSIAAIASEEAAAVFGLTVLERNLNASRSNTTRFAVFSRVENTNPTGNMGSRFILVFTVRNEAGALARAVDVVGRYGFNMHSLRSRPMKDLLWEYYFYLEAEGDIRTRQGEDMMRALSVFCDRLKLVGSYTIS